MSVTNERTRAIQENEAVRRDGVWVFGPIPPEPTGGVSTFVERLAATRPDLVAGVLDPYPGRKNAIPVTHVYPKGTSKLEKLRVLLRIFRVWRMRLMINASRPRASLLFMPLMAFRSAETYLVLHHGHLSAPSSGFMRKILKRCLRTYTRIGCLSEAQRDFYRALGVDDQALVLLDNYIRPIKREIDPQDDRLQGVLGWIAEQPGKVLVGSGYAMDYYHHDWVIDLLEAGELLGASYLLCCYGPRTALYTDFLRRNSELSGFKLVHGLSPEQFSHVLERCDVYVRPTDVDSFGIAVWDAANMGLAVVASNVCERPDQALLHNVGDKRRFAELLREAIGRSRTERHDKVSLGSDRMKIAEFLGCVNRCT